MGGQIGRQNGIVARLKGGSLVGGWREQRQDIVGGCPCCCYYCAVHVVDIAKRICASASRSGDASRGAAGANDVWKENLHVVLMLKGAVSKRLGEGFSL